MCGNHTDPHPHFAKLEPIGRPVRRLHRRAFLGYFGTGTAALAILGPVAAACGASSPSVSPESNPSMTTSAPSATTTETTSVTEGDGSAAPQPASDQWGRANLGNVSAYVLARGSELAIVDTGNPGSVDAIGTTITDLGFTYADVKHVILTHYHGDHAGSIGAVLAAATNATGYAGELDLARIDAALTPLVDDGEVLGMRVVHTPGHTEGHIAMWDQLTNTLIAGDAMNGSDGGVAGANPSYTPDMATAAESIKKMAELQFDTVYFGHGEPVIGGASDAVRDLAAQL